MNKLFLLLFCFFNFYLAHAQSDDSKYPDMVVEAYYSGYFDVLDSLYGGQGLNYPILMDVNKILGNNKEKWFVSLPKDSYMILKFTDNEIIDVPNKTDLKVLEHGCCQEYADVFVSHDGDDFQFLGTVNDCGDDELDLASIGFKKTVRYVKIVGLDVKCASPGFDLVSVFPINGANRELYAKMDEVDDFFDNEKEKRILILENVYFDLDSYEILSKGEADLQKIIQKLIEYSEINIHLTGHTDSIGSKSYNDELSNNRAKSVQDYLLQNGIESNRITVEGKGESQPLRTNETEEGRAINRRVELRRLN